MTTEPDIGPVLDHLRRKAGVTLRELGKRMGRKNVTSMSALMSRGHDSRWSTIIAVLGALGLDLHDLAEAVDALYEAERISRRDKARAKDEEAPDIDAMLEAAHRLIAVAQKSREGGESR